MTRPLVGIAVAGDPVGGRVSLIVRISTFKYASGKSGYNAKIKKLLEHCKIDRLVNQYDEATGTMNRVPLHSVGSSKLCCKTHIDIANKAQLNMYVTGLHEVGSSAVDHYSMLEIRDLFMLLCAAFNQPRYRVDKQLNVLSKEINGSE